jgi:hypothetical protein
MILRAYTIVHVLISLAAIVAGFVVLFGLLANKRLDGWTKWFLITTVATSATGFGFPLYHFGAPHVVGIISLIVLAIAIYARYPRQLAGAWRWIYIVSASVALYLNVFVGVVQAFQKVPALQVLAPTQSEPPFQLTQLVTLLLFIVITVIAAIKFRPDSVTLLK